MHPVTGIPARLLPRRKVTGYSAILLPFHANGSVDWEAFCAHVARTAAAGLIPAINMDTGYGNLIDGHTRLEALRNTRLSIPGQLFTAGAFVPSQAGDAFNADAYYRQIEQIQAFGGIPTIFQSHGLTGLPSDPLIAAYANFGRHAAQFIAFELGAMFAAYGKIYDLETYAGLLEIPQCIGAKHSSLSRPMEWERLALRDKIRPEFKVLSGNDLAIDMIMYGSDYLLGLSTFAPDYFARRDQYWLEGKPQFYELNDILQYLGHFAFRTPVPAYKHSAAQFLKLRGWIGCDDTHPHSPTRPASDISILSGILESLTKFDRSS